MKLPSAAQQLLEAFNATQSWEQKMRLLMQIGSTLGAFEETDKIEANLIQGCESQVWFIAKQADQLWHFNAYSEARLIRGLLAVLLARVNGLTTSETQAIDLEDWFQQLGLANQLSSSRRDGLKAIFQKVKSFS